MSALSGREAIELLKPILGLGDTRLIRQINITANYNEAVIVDVSFVASKKNIGARIEEKEAASDKNTKRFVLTVTEAEQD